MLEDDMAVVWIFADERQMRVTVARIGGPLFLREIPA
jgi:hypothetical protein